MYYQKCDVSLQQLINSIQIDPDKVSPIILSVSPCRSGSTVLLRVFGSSGIQAHYQPIKNTLRWLVQAQEFQWTLPYIPNQKIFIKETLGPFLNIE